jgi:hypothetical protein
MKNLFFHEKRAEIIARQQKELADFDARQPEYDIVYDILADIQASYPDIYLNHLNTFTSIMIPRKMTKAEFNDWLDYLEAEYLSDYNMVRNDVVGGQVIAEYRHKETDREIRLEFDIAQCDVIKKMEYKETYVTNCHWE